MVARRVTWTEDADREKEEILHYWTQRNRSKTYSRKLNLEMKAAVKNIGFFPNIGKTTQVEDVRVLMVGNYSIYYHTGVETIHILSVIDGRRNPAKRPF